MTKTAKTPNGNSHVSPEIRRFAIGVNDWRGWKSDEERTEHLCQIVPALLDTVAPREVVQRRLWILADVAVRVCAPIALDSRADTAERRGAASVAALRDHAGRIRACGEIVDRASALRASEVCRTAAAAAAYADAAAAYAAAAAAAYAAADAAYAAAAYAAAAAAADAYAADDLVESRRAAIRDAIVGALARVCEVRS